MKIDLLPKEYRPQPLFDPTRLTIMIICALIVSGGLGLIGWVYLETKDTESKLASLNSQLESYRSIKLEVERTESVLEDLKKRRTDFVRIEQLYLPYRVYLKKLANSLQEDMWLVNASFAEEKMALSGRSVSFALIGDLLASIKKDGFGEARATEINQITEEDLVFYEFRIEIPHGGGVEKYAEVKKT